MIDSEWEIGGEVVCEYSDDDFDFEDEVRDEGDR